MNIPEIDVQRAKELLDTGAATFVDIRDPGSYEAARIPGAQHLSDANVRAFIDETEKSSTVVVYCYHGNNSMGATAFFKEQGFEDVHSMKGGFEAWRGCHEHESGAA